MIDEELFYFLREHETKILVSKNCILAYLYIQFEELDSFVSIIGDLAFDTNGINCNLYEDCLCIKINDLLEGHGVTLEDYKNCFDQDEWYECIKEINIFMKEEEYA